MLGMNHPSISRQSLSEFKAIWHRNHGEMLGDDEALEMAERLLRVLEIFLRLPEATEGSPKVRSTLHLTDRRLPSTLTQPDQ